MTNTAAVLLVVVAAGIGAAFALVTEHADAPREAEPPPRATEPPPLPPPRDLPHEATSEELSLWNNRGCVTCHGSDGRGSELGPDVIAVLPLYVGRHGTPVAALQPLAAYIFDPKGTPKLRAGAEGEYRLAMPGIAQLPGGSRDEAVALAGLLLRLAR